MKTTGFFLSLILSIVQSALMLFEQLVSQKKITVVLLRKLGKIPEASLCERLNRDERIHCLELWWSSTEDLEKFFKKHNLRIHAKSPSSRLQLIANSGKAYFSTGNDDVAVIIKNGVHIFLDQDIDFSSVIKEIDADESSLK